MSSLRPTRWFNPSLPTMLQIAVTMLYFLAASAVLARLIRFGSPTAYYLLGLKLFGVHVSKNGNFTSGPSTLLDLIAIAGMAYSAAMIASTKKIGWTIATILAAGQVVIPVLVLQFDVLSSDYLINWIVDIGVLCLLIHPQTREYEKIWFD